MARGFRKSEAAGNTLSKSRNCASPMWPTSTAFHFPNDGRSIQPMTQRVAGARWGARILKYQGHRDLADASRPRCADRQWRHPGGNVVIALAMCPLGRAWPVNVLCKRLALLLISESCPRAPDASILRDRGFGLHREERKNHGRPFEAKAQPWARWIQMISIGRYLRIGAHVPYIDKASAACRLLEPDQLLFCGPEHLRGSQLLMAAPNLRIFSSRGSIRSAFFRRRLGW